jgi:hypothetical protein
MASEFQIKGRNTKAPFTLTIYRGDGMALLAMNWKTSPPPLDFVGFAIEYREPGGDKFFPLKNRLGFAGAGGAADPNQLSTRLSPIQKFRWVHFPRNADLPGAFLYRVVPVFMNDADELSYGEAQEVAIELRRETYPGKLDVAFTRGFVSSQAFVDRYASAGPISTLLPTKADDGLTFVPTHPKTAEALAWMGFDARRAVLDVLDAAVQDPRAQVRVIAYDLNEPEVVSRLERLGPRLKVIIDDDDSHSGAGAAEGQAAQRLVASAGAAGVKRQHMGKLQHNKTIVVDAPRLKRVVCGSTNFSWRGFYVQANNVVVLRGANPVKAFRAAFDAYWASDSPGAFGATASAGGTPLGVDGIDGRVAFSPHAPANALLQKIADDIATGTASSLFYSLAFLYQTEGPIRTAITKVTQDDAIFVYGISDRSVGGLDIQKPDGNIAPVYPAALTGDVPEPFKSEPTGGSGNRMHHKFVVIDFKRPTARVYLGSYNFSGTADTLNGENLLVIKNRRVAVSYTVEALRLFDHYHFRVSEQRAREARRVLTLKRPPRRPGETAWWADDYGNPRKIRDRELFA